MGTGQELPARFWTLSSRILLEVPGPDSSLDLPLGLASGGCSFPAVQNPRSLPHALAPADPHPSCYQSPKKGLFLPIGRMVKEGSSGMGSAPDL